MDTTVRFTVNGKLRTVTTDARRALLDVLREELGLTGPKFGCGENVCGACTVLIGGKAVRTCRTPIEGLDDAVIVTIEGLASGDTVHPVQEAFLEESAFQCGYCTPGMILGTVSLLAENPDPEDAAIRSALDGHLCRCCGHLKVLAAVQRAAARMRKGAS
jgi:aerobic-type carbon monoxide dehydrogenase small subunit (CoxS/CutS family)